ncbi:uncharacterized protein BDR25DRAFT_302711 [Lindgomyces ingoldianus]|uniref:Uncharacterized protein n=1 Tax=Lindgomyces ingoldianus TaxID=673940 RepID=A0ACB6R2A8_9PLEO|nr:uncharacterized protein BDR25DRAFT_302711 [Lindgomyces ingoldianus]KAF2472581.1 hypothetical protein BDR25DRAFT_302711 [Lindgomyces ingoldianus]
MGLFGGNASRVTISALSAGGGSVMLQDIIYGCTLGTALSVNLISASPYCQCNMAIKTESLPCCAILLRQPLAAGQCLHMALVRRLYSNV